MRGSGTRHARRRDRTRQALLKAAMGLIAERGIYAARVADITSRANVAKGAFYNYFPSKAALVAELVTDGIRRLEERYRSSSLGAAASSRERVLGLVRAHAAFLAERRDFALLLHQTRGLFMLRGGGDPGIRRALADYLHSLGAAMVPLGESARWTPDEITRLGAAVVGGISGYQSFEIAAGLGENGAEFFEAIAQGIASLVEPRPIVVQPLGRAGRE